jgi:drug/metabolite transporter (DMT)-like permease
MLLKALDARAESLQVRFARMPSSSGPYKVAFGLALIISMDTFVQLFWKMAAVTLPETPSWQAIEMLLHQPPFLLVIGMMLCQLFIWLMVLGEADLSFAQPFFSISRITVCLASVYFLHERIAPAQAVGIALVCAGAWCISRTARTTAPSEPASL